MAKRKAYLHIGLPRTGGGFLDSALTEHADALEEMGVRHPAISAEEMFRAAIEIRRDHQAWGYQRREVEGTWAEICRRAWKGKHDVVFSQELLADCTPEQVDLLLDGLAGFEVHVILTTRQSSADVVTPWRSAIEPDRWHQVVVPVADPEQAVWTAVGEIVGFDATGLPLGSGWTATRAMTGRPQAELLEVISTGTVADVVAEVTRLRAHNQVLAERNAELKRKRKKLKKKLAAVG